MRGEPFCHRLGRRGKPAALTHAEQKQAHGKEGDAARKSQAGTGQRPPDHDQKKAPARSQQVNQLATARIHQGIGAQERGLQVRKLNIRYWDLPLDGVDGHWQRLPIEIADRDCSRNKDRHLPAESIFHRTGFFDTVPG